MKNTTMEGNDRKENTKDSNERCKKVKKGHKEGKNKGSNNMRNTKRKYGRKDTMNDGEGTEIGRAHV